ncbi:hypothetical protein S7711_09769 [Stachybotrys chartarum IBT 7711]|uniref:Heterokaryon incompatibility domain-containing protein n=1 Tax=Stachybotrys chartarum (strain CBS 109288 / IBT 7711) TaxID=1280523 RepID=A0A084BAF7_STACB|nr:hypothetical protein S7711_09769 [Stachybotrys chartarum IBT 7711]
MGASFSSAYNALLCWWAHKRPSLYYDPLNAQHIRLLQFVRPRWYAFGLASPKLILTTHPLHDLPGFVALSYTWGNPNGEPTNITNYEDRFTVQVNGQNASVLRNLRDALHSLLGLWNFDDSVQHLWIDAICINQHDVDERASQVGIMDEIYKRADTTVVWLGKAAWNNSKVTRMFESLCQIPSRELMPYYREYPNGTPPPADFWIARGLPSTNDAEAWTPLTNFFKHCWFNRAWIIQEVTLSTHNIHLFWGRYSLTWEELGHVSFACQVAMIGKLDMLPALSAYHQGESLPEEGQDWAVSDPTTNSFQLWLNRQRYLARINDPANDTLCDEMCTLTGCPAPSAASWLLYFALINRRADATDLRDKIFCNLGLVNNIAKQEGLELCGIQAAYSPDVTSAYVYQQTMERAIQETDSLSVLMALNDPPFLRQDGLPSWVPDFSRRYGLDLMWSIKPRFNVDGSSQEPSEAFSGERRIRVNSGYLQVRCIVVGTVKTLSVSLADLLGKNWYSWAEDLAQLPSTYPYTGQGCVEAFWRTLLMDSVAQKCPAQWPDIKDNNEMLRAFILQRITSQYPGHASDRSLEAYIHELRHLKYLSTTDITGYLPFFNGLRELTSAVTGAPDENLESSSEETIIAALTALSDKASRFIMGMDKSMLNRRLLISDHGHLVNAPLWARPSDRVAIIDGCPCPVVIRGGEQTSYTLIGTAYVHGVMYGEVTRSRSEWDEIRIR